VQTQAETAVALAASHAAKAFGIETGTLVREAQRLCPASQGQANHRLYTGYHKPILKAVDHINDRHGRGAIVFGLSLPDVRGFRGNAAFWRAPQKWESSRGLAQGFIASAQKFLAFATTRGLVNLAAMSFSVRPSFRCPE
jgi:hypothetical protein